LVNPCSAAQPTRPKLPSPHWLHFVDIINFRTLTASKTPSTFDHWERWKFRGANS
jgi:hypothetical protein